MEKMKSFFNYKKPMFWGILLAGITIVMGVVLLLVDAATNGKYIVKLKIERPLEWYPAIEEDYGFFARDEFGELYNIIWDDCSELFEDCVVIVEFDKLEQVVDTDLMGDISGRYKIKAKKVTISQEAFVGKTKMEVFIGSKEIESFWDLAEFRNVYEDRYGYNWIQKDTFEEKCDVAFEIQGEGQVGYYSEKGLLNDYVNNRCIRLPQREKVIFDALVVKYLYPDSVERKLTKWFDFSDNPDGINLKDKFSVKLDEIPGANFIWDNGEVFVTDEQEITNITYGRVNTNKDGACLNAYFYDLTYDGVPELCATLRGYEDDETHEIIIYDYTTGNLIGLNMDGRYEFSSVDNQLVVVQRQEGDKIVRGIPSLKRNNSYWEYEFEILDKN